MRLSERRTVQGAQMRIAENPGQDVLFTVFFSGDRRWAGYQAQEAKDERLGYDTGRLRGFHLAGYGCNGWSRVLQRLSVVSDIAIDPEQKPESIPQCQPGQM